MVTRDATLARGTTPVEPGRDRNTPEVPPTWRGEDVYPVPVLDEAFDQAAARKPRTIFVAGGGEIYRAAWDRLTRLEITEVDAEPVGDVTFPEIRPDEWREVFREPYAGFAFVGYRRL